MKIRTDFVTNSSSSSFVTYKITPGKNKKSFSELYTLLETLSSKYEQRYIPNTYAGEGGLCFDGDCDPVIILTMWTPGLSVGYVEDALDNDDIKKREEIFEEFAKWHAENYPPDAKVAFAVLFGSGGDDRSYLSELDDESKLFDDNGHLSDDILTDLSLDEIVRLKELLDKVDVIEIEEVGGTD